MTERKWLMEEELSEIKEQKKQEQRIQVKKIAYVSLLLVLAFVLTACNMPFNFPGNGDNEANRLGKRNNPVELYGNNITKIKEGQWVKISAPAEGLCAEGGSMFHAMEGSRKKTVFIKYEFGEGKNELDIYAEHALPGKYKEDFASHPPADFHFAPTFVNGEKYSGCRITMLGKIRSIEKSSDGKRACYLEDGAKIEKLEFFY